MNSQCRHASLRSRSCWPAKKHVFKHSLTGVRCGAAGVLLYGPPGTGKTLLARACAAQTNATFLKLAGPQLVQMFIGDGAKLVRDAFALAKEKVSISLYFPWCIRLFESMQESRRHRDWFCSLALQRECQDSRSAGMAVMRQLCDLQSMRPLLTGSCRLAATEVVSILRFLLELVHLHDLSIYLKHIQCTCTSRAAIIYATHNISHLST